MFQPVPAGEWLKGNWYTVAMVRVAFTLAAVGLALGVQAEVGVSELASRVERNARQERDCAPETWFHIIGGNASKEGMAADIAAIKAAGIGGIQLFHGHADGSLWPGVTNPIPCLSAQWADLVRFAEAECHRHGLTFKMQNCPGWSMSGGPWVTPDKAMRKLVCFEPGKMPKFDADDDYREIGAVTFPVEDSANSGWFSAAFPNPQQICHGWAYEPDAKLMMWDGGYPDAKPAVVRECPRGAWQDDAGMTISFPAFPLSGRACTFAVESPHYGHKKVDGRFSCEHRLDMWEAKAGWGLRSFTMSTNATPVKAVGEKTLVFGHVNAKRRNHPAPPEGTGWECDKMDARGFEANFAGYLGKLRKAGVKIDGTLVDSWECHSQSWTWKMEEEFRKRNGYALRPWLPALFGYVLKSEAETERFLLDWRETCSRLVEDNYYGTMARLAHENGMTVQFETAFGDVLTGDPLRYWKYADEPMCEFWSPFDNDKGFVGSHDFKPVRPCVSAAHVYGKRRVSAEAFTSFDLTFDENMQMWKENANRHFARGVTHVVFHTYTHNPAVDGLPPGSSFGQKIGSPFLRGQTWWKFMPGFTKYLADCGRELEKGRPVADILWYLGDALSHRPSERDDLFGNGYKYDYLNSDVLLNGLDVADGRIVVIPTISTGRLVLNPTIKQSDNQTISYRVLWIPEGTFLLPKTEARLAELAKKGARIVRGNLTPDWAPQLAGGDVFWYERQDGDDVCYFIAAKERGFKGALALRDLGGDVTLDLARGESRFVRKADLAVRPPVRRELATLADWSRPLGAWKDLPGTDEEKSFSGTRRYVAKVARPAANGKIELDLGRVAHWARVFVNGRHVADLWCEPYRCDVTPQLTDGVNEIAVEVTSTWYNRLCYDAGRPAQERQTWTVAGPKSGEPLHDSGLIGPVKLLGFAERLQP